MINKLIDYLIFKKLNNNKYKTAFTLIFLLTLLVCLFECGKMKPTLSPPPPHKYYLSQKNENYFVDAGSKIDKEKKYEGKKESELSENKLNIEPQKTDEGELFLIFFGIYRGPKSKFHFLEGADDKEKK